MIILCRRLAETKLIILLTVNNMLIITFESIDGSYNIEKLPKSSESFSVDVIILDQDGQAVIKNSRFDMRTDISVNIANAPKV